MELNLPSSPGPSGSGDPPPTPEEHEEGTEDDAAEPAAGEAPLARGLFLPFDPLPSQAPDPMEVPGSPPRHWVPMVHTYARYMPGVIETTLPITRGSIELT